jgi:hypothetical protein
MRVRNCIVWSLLAAMLVVAPASANLLVNGSFEDQNLDNWVRKDRALNNLWDFPGSPEQKDGLYAARFLEGYFGGNRDNGALTQMVTFDSPFTGDLTISGWVKRYVLDGSFALQPTWGWAAAAIYVDGVHGVTPATSVPLFIDSDDAWHYFEVTLPVADISSVDVAMGWGLRNAGTSEYKTFDVVLMDGWSVVPEPATLGLLALGALPLMRRRQG